MAMVDGNSSAHADVPEHIGDVVHGKSTSEGFIDFLMQNQLWLPATFSSYGGEQPRCTYGIRNVGGGTRIDFVGIPVGAAAVPDSTTTWIDFVMPCEGDDHYPTVTRMHTGVVGSSINIKRRIATYDRNGWKDPEKLAIFEQKICGIELLPCNVEASTHDVVIGKQVHEAAIFAFGPCASKPRQSYVSVVTHGLILQCARYKKQESFFVRKVVGSRMGFVFLTWKKSRMPWRLHSVFGWVSSAFAHRWLWCTYWARWYKRQVRWQVRQDYLWCVQDGIVKGDAALLDRDSTIKYDAIKRLRPKKPRAIKYIADENGSVATSQSEQTCLFVKHFSKVFNADVTTMSEIVQKARADQGEWTYNMWPCERDIDLIPTLDDVQRDFKSMNPNKTIGEGGSMIGPELHHAAAEALARVYHPLFVKIALYALQAVTWRAARR